MLYADKTGCGRLGHIVHTEWQFYSIDRVLSLVYISSGHKKLG